MTTHCGALKLKTAYAGQASLRCVAQQATAEFMKNSVGDGNKGVTICNRSFKFTHFRPLKSIQKKPLNIYHPLHFHAGDGKCAYSGGLAHV